MNEGEGNLKGRIEAILYVSGEPVTLRDLSRALRTDESEVKKALAELRDEYDYNQ